MARHVVGNRALLAAQAIVSALAATIVLLLAASTAAAQAPSAFGKTSPANGATGVSTNPTVLTWQASNNATSYEYCIIAVLSSCSTYTSVGSALSVNVGGLGPSTPFTWQVRAVNASGTTVADGGTFWTFTTMAAPGSFGKISPSDFASQQPTNPTLSWSASNNATSYEYCYDTDSTCSAWTSVGSALSVNLGGLATCSTYYWQIRAVNAGGATYANGSSSSVWRFSTICPPGAFGKITPTNGQGGIGSSTTLSWTPASGATSYQYCVDITHDGVCSPWISAGSSTSAVVTGLAAAVSHSWQVIANGGGATTAADGGTFWTFTTGPGIFNKISPANGGTGVSTSPALVWGTSIGATTYEYCYDTTNNGTCSPWIAAGPSTSVSLSGLTPNVPYSWHVRAVGPTGTTYAEGSSTAFWPFMTGNAGLQGSVQALAVDPSNAQTVYAGTTIGIYKTVNGGATWTRIDSGLQYTNVRALAIRPEAPCTIFAGIDTDVNNVGGPPAPYEIINSTGVLALTNDCGATWGVLVGGPAGRLTESLAFSSTNPSVLYASITVNDGQCFPGFPFGFCIALLKGSVSRITTGTYVQLLDSALIGPVATDPGNGCTTYYGKSSSVYVNTSCSAWNWAVVGGALGGTVSAIAPHPTNQATLLAGTSTGSIYRKADSVSPWVTVASIPGTVNGLVYDRSNPLVAYAAGSAGEVYKSIDGGATWVSTRTIGSPVNALGISLDGSSVYAGGNPFVIGISSGPAPTRIISLAGNLAFGSVQVGATSTRTLTISNTGNGPLNVSSINYPAGFSGAWSGQIPAGGSQHVTVSFSPVAVASFSGVVTVNSDKTSGDNTINASGTGSRPTLLHLDAGTSGDAFVYQSSSGIWARLLTGSGGGFSEATGAWNPGWSVLAAHFNNDGLTDLFLSNSTTGRWFKMVNTGSDFTVEATDYWRPGWQMFVMDLDGDGISDLFLYDPTTGVWYKAISIPGGFTYFNSSWLPGWEITPLNLNGDAFGDMFLYNRTNGRWFWVLGQSGGGFSYPQTDSWLNIWRISAGDFNGDGLSDLLLLDPASGWHFTCLNNGNGFDYFSDFWIPGWSPTVADLNGDGADDLFLYNPATGRWYEVLSDGQGRFVDVASGSWNPGWDIYPTDFNGDGWTDLLLYNPASGRSFQVWNFGIGSFAYFDGYWLTGLTIVVGSR